MQIIFLLLFIQIEKFMIHFLALEFLNQNLNKFIKKDFFFHFKTS
jgi:hypothetical protein